MLSAVEVASALVQFLESLVKVLLMLLEFILAAFPILRLGRRMRKVTANTQEEMGLFTTLLGQTFQGIRVVKAYGMEGYEKSRIADIIERIFRLNMKSVRTRALSSPIMETLGGVAVCIVIIYGGYRVIEGATTSGAFFAFITALLLAYEPMKRLANLNASLQEGLAGAGRLFQLLDTEPTILEKPDAVDLKSIEGNIRLDGVGFSYVAGTPALNEISLEVPAGKRVALVGASGICLLLFIGAMGKSAQLGLHTWLPDAMEGPTPVSALIHAATMVTAGIFMVARLSPMFEYAPFALNVVAVVGASTALFAATVGICQNDIKRVIAYSTCSQLGYMFFACGVSAYAAGIFHLFTHAFFKALLFLGAGSVIHAMSGEQDMRKMGGLAHVHRVTDTEVVIHAFAVMHVAIDGKSRL